MTKQELPLLEKHLEDGAGWFVGNSVSLIRTMSSIKVFQGL